MWNLFEQTTFDCSKNITKKYSTSFSLGIRTLSKEIQNPIYGIYAYVRYADEIVDTFHQFDKAFLLNKFKADTFEAITLGISLNPVIHSFQKIVNQYQIPHELIHAFLDSMEMDLNESTHDSTSYSEYIYGSAEVVGLMCLCVFVKGDKTMYEELKPAARALGAAFQKVNFLRDMQSDFDERGRIYFPNISFETFNNNLKKEIELDIENDFKIALEGIKKLPIDARKGVYLAYKYYQKLFCNLRGTPIHKLCEKRIRIPNAEKIYILFKSHVRSALNIL